MGFYQLTHDNSDAILSSAVDALVGGGCGIVPTETIYGLCCRVCDHDAIDRLIALKGRRSQHPFAVAISDMSEALSFIGKAQPPPVLRAMTHFWPGALTLVVPTDRMYHEAIISDSKLVGLRCPAHPWLQRLLAEVGPLCLTSANYSGKAVVSTMDEVQSLFVECGGVDFRVFDTLHQPAQRGTTVVAYDGGWELLREGDIAFDAILETE